MPILERMIPSTSWRPLVVLSWLVVIDAGSWGPCSSNGAGACLTDPRAKDGYFLRTAAVNCVGLDSLRRAGRIGSCTEEEFNKWRLEGCSVAQEESVCGEDGRAGSDPPCPASQQLRAEDQDDSPEEVQPVEQGRYVRAVCCWLPLVTSSHHVPRHPSSLPSLIIAPHHHHMFGKSGKWHGER